ncbi:MAG: MmoB/DmpM family protein [Thermoactinomyces sp.]
MKTKAAYVGMDLDTSGGDVVEAIIEAVKKDNEGVVVEDFTVFKKVKAPGKLLLRRETVEECLGREWEMDSLQLFMSSYFGFIRNWDEEQMIIHWENE